jgi:hypothetical protein
MDQKEDLGSFFRDNKNLATNYFETRLEIFRLQILATLSKSAGYFIWVIISLFLISLLFQFLYAIAGFWLSELTGSYLKGFGLVALVIHLKIVVLTVFRKNLFVNPIIRSIINHNEKEKVNHQNNPDKSINN